MGSQRLGGIDVTVVLNCSNVEGSPTTITIQY